MIYKKVFGVMLHLEAEWPSKQSILIADTILARSQVLKLREQNKFLGGKVVFFVIWLKQIFLRTTKFVEQKRFGRNCPVSAVLRRTVASNVFHWGAFMLVQGDQTF